MTANKKKALELAKRLWPYFFLALYLLVNGALIVNHENWRDEAQAWQIAKHLSLPGLFQQLKYEGHPCLWFLILLPFAKLGLPFAWMGFLSLLLMAAGAWLLLRKAPFCIPLKALLLFGSFFVYYYPVISRSYCLIPPLLAWLALLYPKRREQPLWYGTALALLTQTHIFMIGLSFLLSFFWLLELLWEWKKGRREKRNVLENGAGMGISLASALFLIWELAGSVGSNVGVDVHISSSLHSNLHRINVGTHWAINELLGMGLSDSAWKLWRLVIVLGMAALLFYAWKEALIYIGTVGIQFLMFTYVNLASPQKAMLLAHELIFILWIILENKKERRIEKWCWQTALALLALVCIQGHGSRILGDLSQAYSSSKGMADYIRTNISADTPVITTGDVYAEGAAAYLSEREIWYPVTESAVTFLVWDEKRSESISYEELLVRVKRQYPDAEEMYLLHGEGGNVQDVENYRSQMQEILRIDATAPNESTVLYYVKF
ncbi:MAG: hypothetical protein HFI29_11295 [Lachnospiraceae bacterium]|jgi:hypothetical protein|nr:hypothetical protein [Lachnospiraceae bacterium]